MSLFDIDSCYIWQMIGVHLPAVVSTSILTFISLPHKSSKSALFNGDRLV